MILNTAQAGGDAARLNALMSELAALLDRYAGPTPPAAGDRSAAAPRATHSPDFAGVNWFGEAFAFSPKQRIVVKALWRAMEAGHRWVGQAVLLELAESEGDRIRDLFRNHPAWGRVIVPATTEGGPPGTYRLADPPPTADTSAA